MHEIKQTPAGDAVTSLIKDLFRLNNRMLTAGDRLVARLGLTSARWQILGAVAAAERSQPVAWLARDLGANRQNVQRIINDLHREGLVAFEANPHHRRAQLVILTEKGRQALAAAMVLQAPWVDGVSDGLLVEDIETAHRVVMGLRHKLERNDDADGQAIAEGGGNVAYTDERDREPQQG